MIPGYDGDLSSPSEEATQLVELEPAVHRQHVWGTTGVVHVRLLDMGCITSLRYHVVNTSYIHYEPNFKSSRVVT